MNVFSSPEQFFDVGHGGRAARCERHEPARAHVDGGALSAWIAPSIVVEVELRDDRFETLGCDAVDSARGRVVLVVVSADARVEPVGDVDRAIGPHRDVRRPEERLDLAVDLAAFEVGARELLALCCWSGNRMRSSA